MSDQEYFTVHHALTINVEPLPTSFVFPDLLELITEIPPVFTIATEFSQLEALRDNAKNELKKSDFKHLLQLLDTQDNKLNLLLNFMLSQYDEAKYRRQTQQFGASLLTYIDSQALELEQKIRLKLFLQHPAAAIYCYAHVSDCQPQEDGYLITLKYDRLREDDQDLLIKAALYQQTQLLRQRALVREQH